MYVGSLGSIPFIVSRNYIRTFRDFGRQGAGRWAKHEIIGDKPVLEFLGPDVEKISFKMLLRAEDGINPSAEAKKLRKLRDDGKAVTLLLGFKVIGKSKWVVESIDETVNYWTANGTPKSISVDVSLTEYVERSVIQ